MSDGNGKEGGVWLFGMLRIGLGGKCWGRR